MNAQPTGTFAKVDVRGLDGDLAWMCFWPFMAHPANVEARERYGAYLMAQLHFGVGNDVSRETLKYLIDAARVGVGRDFENATPRGCMAGDVLLARLEMDKAQVKDAGIDKACHLVSESYGSIPKRTSISRSFLTGDGIFHKASRQTVLDSWNTYSKVAHLWAALLVLLREAEANGVRNEPRKWIDGQKIASIAVALSKYASKVALSRNASPPLPANAIRIVGAKPVTVQPPAPSGHFWTIIRAHVPRKKISK